MTFLVNDNAFYHCQNRMLSSKLKTREWSFRYQQAQAVRMEHKWTTGLSRFLGLAI
jgi:hypothetical protein